MDAVYIPNIRCIDITTRYIQYIYKYVPNYKSASDEPNVKQYKPIICKNSYLLSQLFYNVSGTFECKHFHKNNLR